MKRLIILALLTGAVACTKRPPSETDFLGEWSSSTAAKLTFLRDGTFTGNSLPTKQLIFTDSSGKALTGQGYWHLDEDNGQWTITLRFRSTNIPTYKGGLTTQLQINGSGLFYNNPPFYLFVWKDEPGQDRFEFRKSISKAQ